LTRGTAVFLAAVGGLVVSAACGGSRPPPAPPPPVVAPPPAPRDDGRLPGTATPERYHVDLHIDPSQPRFSGTTTIDVDVPQTTAYVVLHARDMTVARAWARAGGTTYAATTSMRVASGGVVPEELVVHLDPPLPAGKAQIGFIYDAPFADDLAGLYRVKEGDAYYAYTQFESTDARRAFPCFDEPGFKTPYDVTIAAPPSVIALSNAPEAAHTTAPDGQQVLHSFATSHPLPSYLVAFAVGPFDIAEGQKAPFPIRVVTTKGRANLAQLALDVAAELVARLGAYFGMGYPYEKLDLVAVPDFASGAMENPGLVTFRDVLLLVDPKHATTSIRRSQAEVIAHEFAHQWFGDLVTMAWWNDIWLNEGFATWAEAKIVDAWKPSFGARLEQIAGVEGVMDTDAMASARAVREPVRSTSEAMEAFDGITYDKGAAVLRMLEGWLGETTFQRGVQQYLTQHAWGNATAEDLFHALDYVSAQRVDELAQSFLDQPGVPLVTTTVTCETKGPNLELQTSDWRPLGEPEPAHPHAWTLPVCVTSNLEKGKQCFTVGPEVARRSLGPRCPTWVYPNAELAGYYRFVVDRAKLAALGAAGSALSPAERLGLVANAWAGVRAGAIVPDVMLNVLPSLDGETNRFVVAQIIDVLAGVDHALVSDEARPAFRKYVTARLAGHARTLGWWPPNGHEEQDDDRALERRSVLWAMGAIARDPATLAEAEKYAAAWIKDPASVAPDTAAVAVPLASIRAGTSRLDELRAAARTAPTPEARVLAIRAMGAFDDPAVLRAALDVTLGDELKLSELRYVFGAAGRREVRSVLFAWEKENWAKLGARMPGPHGRGMLVDVAGGACTPAERDDARTFFASAVQGLEGVKRPLDEALESAGLCIALRDSGEAMVTTYLARAVK
jgi:cytosol alanyl aminopeptidase